MLPIARHSVLLMLVLLSGCTQPEEELWCANIPSALNTLALSENCEARFTVHHTSISVRAGLRSNYRGRTRLKETAQGD